MPRSMAPPPSNEFTIRVTKSFGQTPTEKIEVIGEPNRPANVKITRHGGKDNPTITVKEGSIQSEDVNELLSLVRPLEGFPTNSNDDIYGFDTRMVFTTFDIQWDNGEDVEGAGMATKPTEENKQTFKDVMDSIMALARQSAK